MFQAGLHHCKDMFVRCDSGEPNTIIELRQ